MVDINLDPTSEDFSEEVSGRSTKIQIDHPPHYLVFKLIQTKT